MNTHEAFKIVEVAVDLAIDNMHMCPDVDRDLLDNAMHVLKMLVNQQE